MMQAQKAPEPRKQIDVQRFYTGTCREIARRPMTIADGGIAGATEYPAPAGTPSSNHSDCSNFAKPLRARERVTRRIKWARHRIAPRCL